MLALATTILAMHCTAEGDLARYRADYDRAVDPGTLIFQSTSKSDPKKVQTLEADVVRISHYEGTRLRFAIRANDPAGQWIEFAVARDGAGHEMGNDVWWYTEAVPSQLVKFDCKTTEAPPSAKAGGKR